MRDFCMFFDGCKTKALPEKISLEGCLVLSDEYAMYNNWHSGYHFCFDRVFKVDRGKWEHSKDFEKYLSDKKIAAYVSEDYKTAFVLDEFYEHFKEITKEYESNLNYISVKSFDDEFFVSDINKLPKEFEWIIWLDDEFMDNNDVPFNYEAYENIIEPKLPYLNPKRFTVLELMEYLSDKYYRRGIWRNL